ncbi:hypothetical protein AX14_007302 [Amanita brunnescens Koide BX004]|nr:hypothetical protein AX14_007302 [Amanita brunnescens Koide BX004]
MLEWQGYITASRVNEGPLTPCSTQVLSPIPSTTGSPAGPNYDPVSKEDQSIVGVYNDNSYNVRDEAPRHTIDITGERNETNATLLKVKDELLVKAVGTRKHSDECFPKEVELAQRVPEDFKPPNRADVQLKWPS